MTLSKAETVARARLGAHTRWANTTDRTAATQAMRDGRMAQFERQVDPDNTLEPAERARRAEHARKAHMQRMALASAKARKANTA